MAPSPASMQSAGPFEFQSALEIDLKNPVLAAFLGWLVPGLGHLYQGRTGKGLLFMICILGTFFYGLVIGQGRVVYASTSRVASRQFLDRWHYICQAGVGLAAMPAYVQAWRVDHGKAPLFGWDGNFMRPPRRTNPAGNGDFWTQDKWQNPVTHPDEAAKWNYDIGDMIELGTIFTVIAGLLNILAIYDAYGGPLILPPPGEKRKKE